MTRPADAPRAAGLQLRDLVAGYGVRPVLRRITLQVAPGEIVAVLGRNGVGRSTLLKAVMGLLPAEGDVQWRGQSFVGWPAHRRARAGLGYVPEHRDIFPGLSVRQNLRLGEPTRGARADGPGAWTVDGWLDRFPWLAARRNVPAGALSGGEQQVLALGRTLMGRPSMLLVDEPTEGLAPQRIEDVAAVLTALRSGGAGVLLVEQKLGIALRIADRCLVMGQGRIVFEGAPAALREAREVQREWLEP